MMWLYCVAYLNRLSWQELSAFSFINEENSSWIFASIIGYIGFGIANVILFAKAIAKISPSVAFAAWTGLALVGVTVIDFLWKDIRFNYLQLISIVLILGGIIGIKTVSDKS
jgi:quaternary ammonium compound-resistance protein SugE